MYLLVLVGYSFYFICYTRCIANNFFCHTFYNMLPPLYYANSFSLFPSQTKRAGTMSLHVATESVSKSYGCATETMTAKTVRTNLIARTSLVCSPSSLASKTTIASR